jgi:hypothetical protein
MTRLFTMLTLLAVSAWAERAAAHGFPITVDGSNKLQVTTEDPTAGSQLVYKVQTLIGNSVSRATDHPGYEGASGFGTGDQVFFDVLGPLWFSSGGAPVQAAAGVTLSIVPQDGTIPGSVLASGSTGALSGFLIGEYDGTALGAYEHQLFYELDDAAGIPAGAYAIALRLRGTNAALEPYVPSDPLVAVFNIGLSIPTLNAIGPSLFSAAVPVPEPSTAALAAVAGMALMAAASGRRRCVATV